jgi:16S rRNA C1402 N4-methylase RsmH
MLIKRLNFKKHRFYSTNLNEKKLLNVTKPELEPLLLNQVIDNIIPTNIINIQNKYLDLKFGNGSYSKELIRRDPKAIVYSLGSAEPLSGNHKSLNFSFNQINSLPLKENSLDGAIINCGVNFMSFHPSLKEKSDEFVSLGLQIHNEM